MGERAREREAGKQRRMNSIKPCSKSSPLAQRFVNIFCLPISDFSHRIGTGCSLFRESNSYGSIENTRCAVWFAQFVAESFCKIF